MSIKGLHKRLTDPIEAFAKLGDTTVTEDGPLTFIDRGGDVLAVAHLDCVDYCKFNKNPKFTKQYMNTRITECPQLDDRLGAWLVLDVLPRVGIKCDVLLTDSEEVGQSTAQHFTPPKQYNWLMQFDRAGSDMVMYEYEDKELREIMQSYGYVVSRGAYSDISYMEHCNAKGFNFGVGYHQQHSDNCYVNLAETWSSFGKVQSFWLDYKDVHFQHEKVEDLWSRDYTSSIGFNTGVQYYNNGEWTHQRNTPGANVRYSTEDYDVEDLNEIARELYGCDYWILKETEREMCQSMLDWDLKRNLLMED